MEDIMPINTKTVYTREALLRFNNYIVFSKKFLWCSMLISTLIIYASFAVFNFLFGDASDFLFFLIFITAFDALFVFVYFVLPILTVKKAKNLNSTIDYTFYDTHIEIKASTAYSDEAARINYTLLKKAVLKRSVLYLMISAHQGYIVDISKLSRGQSEALIGALMKNLGTKNVKITA